MAQKDIRSAKILYEHDADNEIVCFHCQQAIEKYLKGYLICKTGQLQEGHSLIKLLKKAMMHNSVFGSFIKDVAFVNTYYIETRYPATDPLIISTEDVQECLTIVTTIVGEIDKLLHYVFLYLSPCMTKFYLALQGFFSVLLGLLNDAVSNHK